MKTDAIQSAAADARSLVLLGAVCGDIIGSCYEFVPVKWLDFDLFTRRSKFTDDTVCSVAVADALTRRIPFAESLRHWCRKYPRESYGYHFRQWMLSDSPEPYNSWGNGSAMRVSAVGAYGTSFDEVMRLARESAAVTHSHPEGIKGGQATAAAIYYALCGRSKDEIKTMIETEFGYDLSRSYADIQPGYSFDVSCQGSVPESIIAFLESTDYESAIRMAVAYGGDADTQGAITGGIAAAYYGEIPREILDEAISRLPADLRETISAFNRAAAARSVNRQ